MDKPAVADFARWDKVPRPSGETGGANLSTAAANGIYSFGSGTAALGDSDRVVGFLSSGTAGAGTQSGNLYAHYTNSSGGNLTGLGTVTVPTSPGAAGLATN